MATYVFRFMVRKMLYGKKVRKGQENPLIPPPIHSVEYLGNPFQKRRAKTLPKGDCTDAMSPCGDGTDVFVRGRGLVCLFWYS